MIYNYIGLASLNRSINDRPYISYQNSNLLASSLMNFKNLPTISYKPSLIKHIECTCSRQKSYKITKGQRRLVKVSFGVRLS